MKIFIVKEYNEKKRKKTITLNIKAKRKSVKKNNNNLSINKQILKTFINSNDLNDFDT